MQMQGREFAGGMRYRWGFGAQETDEHMGESYAYKFRFYESRLCRFLTVDPISFQYPWNSSYAFAENKVIRCIDLEGKEAFLVGIKNNGETVISISDRTQFGIEHWSLVCEDPTICAPPNSLYGSASHFVPTVYQRARSNIGTAVSVYTFTASETFETPFNLVENAVRSFQSNNEDNWNEEKRKVGSIERGVSITETSSVRLSDIVKEASGNRNSQGSVPLPNSNEQFIFTRVSTVDLKTINVRIEKSVIILGSDMESDFIRSLSNQFSEQGFRTTLLPQKPGYVGSLNVNDPRNSGGIDIQMSYQINTEKVSLAEPKVISETVQRTSTGDTLTKRNP
jgi:RHS repeat-associated protein